ncbi:DUF3105 domain-containing protein [Marmoricola sp. RAF53]|uniref:DUF3105 domain-containing protein n=1 Tax=Marmoricola sp. RAF53 TaxID=3233059 RepID=UPI003F9E7C9F
MAKKNPKNTERRALVEQMRQEQARKERRRSMLILGGCIVVVLGLLAAALVPYLNSQREKDRFAGLELSKVGVAEAAAACSDVTTKSAAGSGEHKDIGTKLDYPDAPPAFGAHWPNFLTGVERKNFFSPEDRPEVERLVHSLEHGHTLYWYDETVKPGTGSYEDLQAIAAKFSDDPSFNIVPWTSADGAAFPDGRHVVLTHWTGPDNQKGAWQYCGKPSGEVVASFIKRFPRTDAPEDVPQG